MSKQYVIVNGDDWEGIYVDGVIASQGHSHRAWDMLEIIKEHGAVGEFWEFEPDMDWLSDLGHLPDTLAEVKFPEPFLLPAGLKRGEGV